jgi:hypothetical protein
MPSDDSSINGVDVVGVEAFKLPPDKVAGLAIQRAEKWSSESGRNSLF